MKFIRSILRKCRSGWLAQFLLLTLSLLGILPLQAQEAPRSPLATVQAQLDAYNLQDVDAFTAVFAEHAQVYSRIGDSIPSMTGRHEIRKRYAALFAQYPDNYSTLTGRIVQGNYVIDHEYLTGRGEALSIVAIYEVEQGEIVRCWFAR